MWSRAALVIGIFGFLPVAHAQFLPGSLMGQTCPYPFAMAPGAFNPNDAQSRADALRQKADREAANIDKLVTALEDQIETDTNPLYSRLWGVTVAAVLTHMRERGEAGGPGGVICGMQAPMAAPVPEQYQQPPPQQSPPPGAIPEGAVKGGINHGADNQSVDSNRKPAAEGEAAVPVAPKGAVEVSAQPSDGAPPKAIPAPVMTAPPQEQWPGVGPAALSLCADSGENKFSHYALAAGEVNPQICMDNYMYVQLPGPTPATIVACQKALSKLNNHFRKLAELNQRKLKVQMEADAAADALKNATTEGGARLNPMGREQFSSKLGPLFNMLQAMRGSQMAQPMYPPPTYSPLSNYMYGTSGYGFPNVYNGGYGMGPGGIGRGMNGCNGVNNPNLFGPSPFGNPLGFPTYGLGAGPGLGMPQPPRMLPPAMLPAYAGPQRPGGWPAGYRPYGPSAIPGGAGISMAPPVAPMPGGAPQVAPFSNPPPGGARPPNTSRSTCCSRAINLPKRFGWSGGIHGRATRELYDRSVGGAASAAFTYGGASTGASFFGSSGAVSPCWVGFPCRLLGSSVLPGGPPKSSHLLPFSLVLSDYRKHPVC